MRLAAQPMVLLPRRQLRKGRPEMALRLAVTAALTAKAVPLPDQGQGSHRTPAEDSLGDPGVARGAKRACKSHRP